MADIAEACHDRDRLRLRDHVAAQHRDRVHDGSGAALAEADHVEVTEDDVTLTNGRTTAAVHLRLHHDDGTVDDLADTWRFQTDRETAPTTTRDERVTGWPSWRDAGPPWQWQPHGPPGTAPPFIRMSVQHC